jgi:hypothetical protein
VTQSVCTQTSRDKVRDDVTVVADVTPVIEQFVSIRAEVDSANSFSHNNRAWQKLNDIF